MDRRKKPERGRGTELQDRQCSAVPLSVFNAVHLSNFGASLPHLWPSSRTSSKTTRAFCPWLNWRSAAQSEINSAYLDSLRGALLMLVEPVLTLAQTLWGIERFKTDRRITTWQFLHDKRRCSHFWSRSKWDLKLVCILTFSFYESMKDINARYFFRFLNKI